MRIGKQSRDVDGVRGMLRFLHNDFEINSDERFNQHLLIANPFCCLELTKNYPLRRFHTNQIVTFLDSVWRQTWIHHSMHFDLPQVEIVINRFRLTMEIFLKTFAQEC